MTDPELVAQLVSINRKLEELGKQSLRHSRLLTIPETAALYRVDAKEVRRLIDAGTLKAAMRKPRRGSVGYLVDARSAEAVLGAR